MLTSIRKWLRKEMYKQSVHKMSRQVQFAQCFRPIYVLNISEADIFVCINHLNLSLQTTKQFNRILYHGIGIVTMWVFFLLSGRQSSVYNQHQGNPCEGGQKCWDGPSVRKPARCRGHTLAGPTHLQGHHAEYTAL